MFRAWHSICLFRGRNDAKADKPVRYARADRPVNSNERGEGRGGEKKTPIQVVLPTNTKRGSVVRVGVSPAPALLLKFRCRVLLFCLRACVLSARNLMSPREVPADATRA